MEFYMIRHGMTKENQERRYLGVTDASLLDEAVKQLQQDRMQGRYPECEGLYCSPMLRCKQTAKVLYPEQEPVLIPEWREMDFGAFEGKTYQELKKDPAYMDWLESGGNHPCPGGEGRAQFVLRAVHGFYHVMDLCMQTGITQAVAVVHGGTIMALVSSLYGGDYYAYQVGAGCGYAMELCESEEGWEVTRLWEI